jgi:RNA polymerase sigma factor (sigma-70 family)
MMTTKLMPVAANNDAELVAGTLAGNRDAFSQIVSRYQSLVCSLTYSATGNLGQSEDLAQETFITAWKHLVHLRERDKLRAWLCGIARNRINNFLRREGREPSHRAESLEEISASHSPEPLPVEHTISNEEAGDSLAFARTHPGNLPRTARPVLPRTSIHRSRRRQNWN